MDKNEWQQRYEACLVEHFDMTGARANLVFKSNAVDIDLKRPEVTAIKDGLKAISNEEWRQLYESYLVKNYSLTAEEAKIVFDDNVAYRPHDYNQHPAGCAADDSSCVAEKDIINVVLSLGGKEVVLKALGWRPVGADSYHANDPIPHWIPPYNSSICFPIHEAVKTAFKAWIWSDMANGELPARA